MKMQIAGSKIDASKYLLDDKLSKLILCASILV